MDTWSGRAHAILPLCSPVCLTAKGREGPKILADLAGRLLAAALGGSLLPARSVAKNPWGRQEALTGHLLRIGHAPAYPELHELTQARGLVWHTIPGTGPVELKSVIDALAPQYWHEPAAQAATPHRKGNRRGTPNPLGRNTILFDRVRWWAYDREEKDLSEILAEALRVNAEFSSPLPSAEVTATAKSIAKFMAVRFRPRTGMNDRIKRGRDKEYISAHMTMEERQSVSGYRTTELRTQSTLSKLFQAADRLSEQDKIPTQSAIAEMVGISLKRVKQLWKTRGKYGVLSGSGTKDQGGQGESITLKEYCNKLTLSIQRKKEEAQKIQIYAELTRRMMKRGARPENVPPRGPDASPEVREAHQKALAARKDAVRRQESRAEREDQKARRAERLAKFQSWAQAGDREAFEAFYEQEMGRWDALEILIDPEEKEKLRTHHLRKFTHLKRVRQEWNRARQGGLRRQNGVRRVPDFIDERVSKICVERMIEDRNPDILA
jgi:hypothetical protein